MPRQRSHRLARHHLWTFILSCIDIPYQRICQHITLTRETALLETVHSDKHSCLTRGYAALSRRSYVQCFLPKNHYLARGSHPTARYPKMSAELITTVLMIHPFLIQNSLKNLDFWPPGHFSTVEYSSVTFVSTQWVLMECLHTLPGPWLLVLSLDHAHNSHRISQSIRIYIKVESFPCVISKRICFPPIQLLPTLLVHAILHPETYHSQLSLSNAAQCQ